MTEKKDSSEQSGSGQGFWYVWEIALIGLILLYGAQLDHFGVINYIGGRLSTFLGYYQMLGLMYLFVPAAICLLALIRRMCLAWRWRIANRRRRGRLRLAVIVGLLIYFAIPFTEVIPVPRGYMAFAYGFKERIEPRVDVSAIRAWLVALNPADCQGDHITLGSGGEPGNSKWPDTIPWPESITCFNPTHVCLSVDQKNRPMIELTWGGGVAHWGLTVGDENMEIRALAPGIDSEYRIEFCKGAYVWVH